MDYGATLANKAVELQSKNLEDFDKEGPVKTFSLG